MSNPRLGIIVAFAFISLLARADLPMCGNVYPITNATFSDSAVIWRIGKEIFVEDSGHLAVVKKSYIGNSFSFKSSKERIIDVFVEKPNATFTIVTRTTTGFAVYSLETGSTIQLSRLYSKKIEVTDLSNRLTYSPLVDIYSNGVSYFLLTNLHYALIPIRALRTNPNSIIFKNFYVYTGAGEFARAVGFFSADKLHALSKVITQEIIWPSTWTLEADGTQGYEDPWDLTKLVYSNLLKQRVEKYGTENQVLALSFDLKPTGSSHHNYQHLLRRGQNEAIEVDGFPLHAYFDDSHSLLKDGFVDLQIYGMFYYQNGIPVCKMPAEFTGPVVMGTPIGRFKQIWSISNGTVKNLWMQ
ncbi:MAG: hypothetical protein AB7F43_10155 [Bacteriovoracia bacterium]